MNDLPSELWALRFDDDGSLLTSFDEDEGDGSIACWPSEAKAIAGLKMVLEMYLPAGFSMTPVRLFPRSESDK